MNKAIQAIIEFLGSEKITLVDVGASGGVHSRWKALSSVLQVIGFEPNQKEFRKLGNDPNHIWFNMGLARSSERRTLYITEHESNVSLYRPNYELLNQFQWTPKPNPISDFNIIEEVEISCETLDKVMADAGINPDFLKVDTQGTELEILEGAPKLLANDLLVVEIEVEFASLYQNQPLFADVDSFMRQFGFILQDIGNILYIKPRGCSGIGGPKGRIVAADALYIKDMYSSLEWIISRGTVKISGALLGYLAYGYPELALTLLTELNRKGHRFSNDEKLCQELLNLSHRSKCWTWVPKRQRLLKSALKTISNLRDVEHYFLDVPLGNDLKLK